MYKKNLALNVLQKTSSRTTAVLCEAATRLCLKFYLTSKIRFLLDRQSVNSRPRLPYAYADIAFSKLDTATEVCEL